MKMKGVCAVIHLKGAGCWGYRRYLPRKISGVIQLSMMLTLTDVVALWQKNQEE